MFQTFCKIRIWFWNMIHAFRRNYLVFNSRWQKHSWLLQVCLAVYGGIWQYLNFLFKPCLTKYQLLQICLNRNQTVLNIKMGKHFTRILMFIIFVRQIFLLMKWFIKNVHIKCASRMFQIARNGEKLGQKKKLWRQKCWPRNEILHDGKRTFLQV